MRKLDTRRLYLQGDRGNAFDKMFCNFRLYIPLRDAQRMREKQAAKAAQKAAEAAGKQ